MRIRSLFAEFRQRRVIRAAIIFLALAWVVLQAADLFAGAGIIRESTVRWLIVAAIAGFPLVVVGSWFLESPWKDRRSAAIAGDVVVILAITLAAALLAWQQWFQSFTRPTVAVLVIEATDTSEDTQDLADHIARRVRMALATRLEIRVLELESSRLPQLSEYGIAERAAILGAGYLLTGTLSRNDRVLRLSLQLFDAEASLLWSESFEDRLIDLQQMLSRVISDLWPALPTRADALPATRDVLSACEYPADFDAIMALARSANRALPPESLAPFIEQNEDNALLYIEQARRTFGRIASAAPHERPVMHRLASRALEVAAGSCPGHPDVGLLRLTSTRAIQADEGDPWRHVASFPNSAGIYIALAERNYAEGNDAAAEALLDEALMLDPVGHATLCAVHTLTASATSGPAERAATRLARFYPQGCDQTGLPTMP